MRIHFFTIEVENSPDDLPAVFERLRESQLADREQEINNKPVFLETCDQGGNGSYELNFTQRRVQNGSGYSKRGELTIRTVGLARAKAAITMANIAYNMGRLRWLPLIEQPPAPNGLMCI